MESYGLDCVDLVVSHTTQFLFIAKKVQILRKSQITLLKLSTDIDQQTATLRKNNLFKEERGDLRVNPD